MTAWANGRGACRSASPCRTPTSTRGATGSLRKGILPFLWDGSEVDPELLSRYRGPAGADYTPDGDKH